MFFKDLRHDWLETWLWCNAEIAISKSHATHDQLELLHLRLCPDGWGRGFKGSPRWVGKNGLRIPEKKRDHSLSLNNISGITGRRPLGAFCVFPNITRTGMKCRKLSEYLLNNASVAVLPGTAFGQYGEGYLRLSFANSVQNIQRALNRLSEAFKNL